jgi:transposase
MNIKPALTPFKLSDSELTAIDQIIKTSDNHKLIKRATGILMLHHGLNIDEIGRILAVSVSTVYNWFHGWKAEGLQGLESLPKEHQSTVPDAIYLEVVKKTLDLLPAELGYDYKRWTINRLNQHISRVTGKQVSDEYLRQIVRAHGWVYRQPKQEK